LGFYIFRGGGQVRLCPFLRGPLIKAVAVKQFMWQNKTNGAGNDRINNNCA
jgi:hypothetical protein